MTGVGYFPPTSDVMVVSRQLDDKHAEAGMLQIV